MTLQTLRRSVTAGLILVAFALTGCGRAAPATPPGLVTLDVSALTSAATASPGTPPAPSTTAATLTPFASATTAVHTVTPAATPGPATATGASQISGTLDVTFTEAQLTELVRPGLERGTGELTFSGTQVSLRGGLMTISATATVSGLSAPANLALSGAVVDGQVVFTATSAALGPFDLPAESLEALSAGINTAVNTSLRQEAPNVRPTALTIADGTLKISGEILGP